MLQQAAIERRSPIVLVGMDLNFQELGVHGRVHFSDEYELCDRSALWWEVEEETHQALWAEAKRNFDRLGIEVFNATPGGSLDLFPRVRLEDIT